MIITSEGHADMIIEHDDFSYCAWVLQLEHRLLFYTKYNHVLASYTDLSDIYFENYEGHGRNWIRTAHVPFLTASDAYST